MITIAVIVWPNVNQENHALTILNGEPVLALNYHVENIQIKIQNNFIIVDSYFISGRNQNVNNIKTRQRCAIISSHENNPNGYDYKLLKHWSIMYFMMVMRLVLELLVTDIYKGVIQIDLITDLGVLSHRNCLYATKIICF